MNLIGDPWIPAVFHDGTTRSIGLGELYEQAEAIRDLALAPPQRISVMRLLICITQAALEGPADTSEWRVCAPRITPESLMYLESRRGKFDLFGETPFMQVKDLEADKSAPLDKLDFGLASGNNKTLFDHEAAPEGRTHPASWTAIHLLTFLNFSTGGKVGQANWGKQKFSDSTKATPVVKAAHAFSRGKNLRETICLNLITQNRIAQFPNGTWGLPVWDLFPKSPDDKKAVENATSTYLGRLVPLTRLIKIYPLKDAKGIIQAGCIIGPPMNDLAFEGPPAFREASTSLITNNKGEYTYLTISVDRHIWRELGAVLVLNKTASEAGGPPTLHNLQVLEEDKQIDIWIGGLIPSQADIQDAVEWNLSIPTYMLQGDERLTSYQNNVALAERVSTSLSAAIHKYLDEFKVCNDKDRRSRDMRNIINRAQTIYWQELDQQYEILFEDKSVDERWRSIVRQALLLAYERSCAHETPRQIQAFAIGQRRLGLYRLTQKGEKNA